MVKTCVATSAGVPIPGFSSALSYYDLIRSDRTNAALTQGMRGEMAPHGVKVLGVYPGPVETRMTEGLEMPKTSPDAVAKAIVDGMAEAKPTITPDPMSSQLYGFLLKDYESAEKEIGAVLPRA